ncbi:hypothetical protein PHSC3_002039 [Chlamydiales bacterium STE3]|nr:hypothetical protein PHSC3_002039 [Chlamydiales bacterium STE3]
MWSKVLGAAGIGSMATYNVLFLPTFRGSKRDHKSIMMNRMLLAALAGGVAGAYIGKSVAKKPHAVVLFNVSSSLMTVFWGSKVLKLFNE